MVLAAMMASMVLMTVLTGLAGFTRILALGHIFWIPLLYFLWTRLGEIPPDDLFGVWIRALIVLNALALAIDAIDVARYISSDREETVKGL